MNEEVESVPKVKRQKSPVKKPKKKRKQEFGPDFDLYYSKTFDRLADEHPELKNEDIEKYLRKVWLAMNDTQKLKLVALIFFLLFRNICLLKWNKMEKIKKKLK